MTPGRAGRTIPNVVFTRTVLLLLSIALTPGCATIPREADPLPIERIAKPKPVPPLIIRRAHLHEVLRKGPGRFLARTPVEPARTSGRRFVGFRLLALYGGGAPHPDGLHVGDVVTAINEMPIARPEQFMKVWQVVAHAPAIEIDVIRDRRPIRVTYRIVD